MDGSNFTHRRPVKKHARENMCHPLPFFAIYNPLLILLLKFSILTV